MKRLNRILIGIGCAVLLAISWFVAISAKTDAQKQIELIESADAYVKDEIYILAVPLLEEAAGYDDEHTLEAEEALKNVYLHLIDQSGYRRKYTNLLNKQMSREDAAPEVFLEAANYYLSNSKEADAFAVLRDGIVKTEDQRLTDLYESSRYVYTMGRSVYQEVTAIYNGSIQVMRDNLWGLANSSGDIVIPCQYDRISTYSNEKAIVSKDGVISAVDENNNRVALLHGDATDFGNYAQDRLALKTGEGWKLATGTLSTGTVAFDELGMYSNGGAPAKEAGGKWGVVDTSGGEWVVAPEYEGIICDELNRCYAQGAVFVVDDAGLIWLLVDGELIGDTYEDARPFDDGWAAVKKDGKWGFIDIEGTVQIDFQFDDALSFGQHLAAVKVGDYWGYASLYGEVVIEPVFLDAKSFSGGSAPVQTGEGWQFITLKEYKGGTGL